MLKHLILKQARLFFLVITWELGNMMVEKKKLSIVSCYYGLVIKEYNLIQFSSFFGSSFCFLIKLFFFFWWFTSILDPLILKYAEHP